MFAVRTDRRVKKDFSRSYPLSRPALFAFAPLAALWVFAQTSADSPGREHVIPLVADGEGFRSHLFVGNASGGVNQCSMELVGEGLDMARFGDHVAVAPDGIFATVDLSAPDTTISLASLGEGAFATGYAKLSCAAPAAVRLLLTSAAGGASVPLATVESAPSGADFALPAPPGPGSLGLALANDGRVTASCAVALQDRYATTVAEGVWRIPPRSSDIRFLDDIVRIPSGYPGGSVALSCDPGVHALGRPAGGVLFSALPAAGRSDDAVSPRAGMASGVLTAAATGDDFGDDRFSAEPVEIPSTTAGYLDAGDVDYFRVEIGSPGTLTVETTGSVDTYGYLENENGRPLRFNNDGGEGLNFRIETGKAGDRLPALSAGVYYVHVRGIGGGSYELVVSGTAQGPGALPAAAAPTVSIDAVPAGDENTAVQLGATLTGGAYDGSPEYAWSVSGGALDNPASATPTWTRPAVSANADYTVSLVVTVHGAGTNARNGGSATANASQTTQVRDVPAQLPPAAAPTVSIDAVPAGDENTSVTLGATLTGGTYDGTPDYAWSVSGGALNDSTLAAPTWTRPSVNADGDYTVSLVVTVRGAGTNAQNGGSATANASRTAQVRDVPVQLPPAAAPTVSIDAVAAGDENTSVTLGATLTGGTYDGAVEYDWDVSGGALDDDASATPTWTRPTVAADTDYTVSLTVTVRGTGASAQNNTSATANAPDRTAQVRDTATTPPPATSCVDDAKWDTVAEYYDANKNRNPNYGANWYRVLIAYRVEDPERTLPAWEGATVEPTTAFTATEATSQENVWSGWTPVREVLECLEAAPATPATLPAAAAPSVSVDAVPAGDEGTPVTLGATLTGGTYDGAVEYAWRVASGALDDATSATPVWTRPSVNQNTSVSVELRVTVRGAGVKARDGTSDTSTPHAVGADVRDANPAPVAPNVDINPVQIGIEGAKVQFGATLTGGSHSGTLTYQWSVDGGTLDDPNSATPTWTRPSVSGGSYFRVRLQVTVTDSGGADSKSDGRFAWVRNTEAGQHDNTRDHANPVAFPASVIKHLALDDVDYYRFSLPSETRVAILSTGSIYAWGKLLDGDGNRIAEKINADQGLVFKMVRTLAAGDYFVEVSQLVGTGNYALVLKEDTGNAPPTACVSDEDWIAVANHYLTNSSQAPNYGADWYRVLIAYQAERADWPLPEWRGTTDQPTTPYTAAEATAKEAEWSGWTPARKVLDCLEGGAPASAPTVSIDAIPAGDEGTTVDLSATLTGGIYDGAVEYAWQVDGGPRNDNFKVDGGTLDDATSATPKWTRPSLTSDTSDTSYRVRLTVTVHGTGANAIDGSSDTANASRWAVVRETTPQLPVASAPKVSIKSIPSGGEGKKVRLSATLTGGNYDGALEYAWQVDGGTLDDPASATPTWTRPSVSAWVIRTAQLTVTARGTGTKARNNTSDTATDSAGAIVLDAPLTPYASAPSVSINAIPAGDEGTKVGLSATLIGDVYDGPPEYAWTVTGGTLDDATSATPTWTRPVVGADASYAVQLTVKVRGAGVIARNGTTDKANASLAALVRNAGLPLPLASAPSVSINAIRGGDEGKEWQLAATLSGGNYDGSPEYAWTVTGGTLDDAASATPTWTRPPVTSNTSFTVELTVTVRGANTKARAGSSAAAKASQTALVRDVSFARENNCILATPTPIGIPSVTQGYLTPRDRHYFRIHVAQAGTLTLTTTGRTDTYGILHDSDCAERRRDDDSGVFLNFNITTGADTLAAGTYYLLVRGYGGSTQGNYSLSVTGSALAGTPPAIAPAVTIDPFSNGDEGKKTALSASLVGGAYDGEPVYAWRVNGGALDDPTSATPIWTLPSVSADTNYQVSLTVTVEGEGTNALDATSATATATRNTLVRDITP